MSGYCEQIAMKGHEQVSFFSDRELGFTAIIAIHDRTLGPALGGCRMRRYLDLDEALIDVLRLSEAMSYKNALCGINFGGGKSVIVEDPSRQTRRPELFQRFGEFVASLQGRYITAEDMGTSVADMMEIAKAKPSVAGRDPAHGGVGDPSPATAEGVFEGMKACLDRVYGTDSFSGRRVTVQGIGNVGAVLVQHLTAAGAEVILSDINRDRGQSFAADVGARYVEGDAIYTTECDIFAPCAIGGILNQQTVGHLRCRVVAGAANNQLATPEVEKLLASRGILYAPDFALNAGGVILCAEEFESGGFQADRAHRRVLGIRDTIAQIFERSERTGSTAGEVALELAYERIRSLR